MMSLYDDVDIANHHDITMSVRDLYIRLSYQLSSPHLSHTHTNTQYPAPSDAPQNFIAVTLGPRTISLNWSRPSTPNGVITNYSLEYRSSTDRGMKVYNSTILSAIVENLNEFTSYTFQLSANTTVGGGPAANAMAMTDEDGRHYTSRQ